MAALNEWVSLEDIFGALMTKKREHRLVRKNEMRDAIVVIGKGELGDKHAQLDTDYFGQLIEEHGWTEADIRRNVELYEQHIQQAEIARNRPAFEKAAAAAEVAHREADEKEAKRHREERVRIDQLYEKATHANGRLADAIAAEGNLLGSSELSPGELELCDELARVKQRSEAATTALNPNARGRGAGGRAVGGGLWPSIATNPAALAADTARLLKEVHSSLSKERRAALSSQLAAAERAIAVQQRELATAEKEANRINTELTELAAARWLPENFRLVRTNQDPDIRRKELASQLGL